MANLDVAVRLKFLTDGEGKLKAAAKSLADFSKSASRLSGRATGRFGGDLNKAWHASVKLGGALDKSAKSAGKTATGLRAIGTGASGIDRARASVDRLTKSTNALGAADRKVRLGAAASGGGSVLAAGALGGAMARRKAALKEGFAEAASHVSPGAGYLVGAGTAVAVGGAVGATAAAGIGAAALATKEAISREVAFAQVQKKVNLEAGQSWKDIDRQIAKVSRTLGIAYQDAAAMFDTGGGGGIGGKDLESFAMLAGKVAMAWDIGNREAALGLVQTRAQLQKAIPDLEAFADKINYLSDISAAAERDVFNMSQRAIAGMKAAGVNEDQSLSLMTGLRSVGMQDEVGARFLNSLTSTLRRASMLKDAPQNALKTLGLDPKAVELGMQVDAMKTIVSLLERLGKAKNPVAVANNLVGAQWADELMIMKDALPEIVRVFEALGSGKWRGSMTGAMDIQLSTTDAKLKQLKESILDIAATAAKPIVLPWLSDVADKWKAAADRYREAQQRSEDSRASVKPVGRSSDDYAHDLKLDRPIRKPAPAMFTQIEGATPHVAHLAEKTANGKPMLDLSQFGPAAEKAVGQSSNLYDTLQKLNTTVHPQVDTSIIDRLNQIESAAARANAALRNFGAPSSGTRVNPTLTGAPRGGGGSTGGGGSAPATPGKQARLGRSHVTHIAAVHVHGARNLASIEREINRKVRSASDNALHDIG